MWLATSNALAPQPRSGVLQLPDHLQMIDDSLSNSLPFPLPLPIPLHIPLPLPLPLPTKLFVYYYIIPLPPKLLLSPSKKRSSPLDV